MTAPILLQPGPRATPDNQRISVKLRVVGQDQDFDCVLGDCEGIEPLLDKSVAEEKSASAEPEVTLVEAPSNNSFAALLIIPTPDGAPFRCGTHSGTALQVKSFTSGLRGANPLMTWKFKDPECTLPIPRLKATTLPDTLIEVDQPTVKESPFSRITVITRVEHDNDFAARSASPEPEVTGTRGQEAPVGIVLGLGRGEDQVMETVTPSLCPSAQILSRMADLTFAEGSLSTTAARSHLHLDAPAAFSQSPTLKVLRVRLEPESLGEVEVTLRQSGKDMRIDIVVSHSTTAEALSRDMTLLEDRLSELLGSSASTAAISISLQSGSLMEPRSSSATPQTFATPSHGGTVAGGEPGRQNQSQSEAGDKRSNLRRRGTDEDEASKPGSAHSGRVV